MICHVYEKVIRDDGEETTRFLTHLNIQCIPPVESHIWVRLAPIGHIWSNHKEVIVKRVDISTPLCETGRLVKKGEDVVAEYPEAQVEIHVVETIDSIAHREHLEKVAKKYEKETY